MQHRQQVGEIHKVNVYTYPHFLQTMGCPALIRFSNAHPNSGRWVPQFLTTTNSSTTGQSVPEEKKAVLKPLEGEAKENKTDLTQLASGEVDRSTDEANLPT